MIIGARIIEFQVAAAEITLVLDDGREVIFEPVLKNPDCKAGNPYALLDVTVGRP